MNRDDMSRRFLIDVDAGGAFTIRPRGQVAAAGSLPVFSTDTHEEAESLQVYHCRLARDGSGVYFLNEPPADVLALEQVTNMLRATYTRDKSKPAKRV